MKRFITLLLALTLCMSLAVPAAAEEETSVPETDKRITVTTKNAYSRETKLLKVWEGDTLVEKVVSVTILPDQSAALIIEGPEGTTDSCYAYSYEFRDGGYMPLFVQPIPEIPCAWRLDKPANHTPDSIYSVIAGPLTLFFAYRDTNVRSKDVAEDVTPTNPFTDVPADAYYHDAVLWALRAGVTTGVSATTFAPMATCTRGQVVTFLWRAFGKPEPQTTENPFTDVSETSAFYKAILWAYENGITSGVTADTFNPGGTCSSGHVVTFLWRANGKPAATGDSMLAAAYPDRYFTDALAWADSAGLLSGTGSALVPADNSPRADIVTYLYRNAQ